MARSRRQTVIPLVCVVVVIGAVVALSLGGRTDDETQPAASSAGDARSSAIERALAGEAQTSSKRHFLRDLEQGTEKALSKTSEAFASYAVAWRERQGLQAVSSDVLGAYRKQDGYAVASSGYLDIKGNVWGALLTKGKAAVDMVVVTCDEDDSECTARIVRLVPTGKDGTGDG